VLPEVRYTYCLGSKTLASKLDSKLTKVMKQELWNHASSFRPSICERRKGLNDEYDCDCDCEEKAFFIELFRGMAQY